MDEFLKSAKCALGDLESYHSVRIVVGNEACDLDSAVSSLVYAYFLYKQNDFPVPNNLVIPLLDIQSGDYKLKTEVKYYLDRIGIHQDSLIFRDDPNLDIKDLHAKQKLLLTLVDHNGLPRHDKYLSSSVVEIIDHHQKDPSPSDQYCDILIENVGSCCTLVAEKILHKEPCILDATIIEMLYGAIILDTIYLNPKDGRTKPKDVEIVSRLESHLPGLYGNRRDIYEGLVRAKTDVSGLTDLELLRKDLKCVRSSTMNIGTASFPVLIENVLRTRNGTFLDSMSQFCQTNEFQILVMLGIRLTLDGSDSDHVTSDRLGSDTQRDLGIFSENVFFREQLSDFLLGSDEAAHTYNGSPKADDEGENGLGKPLPLDLEVVTSPWPDRLTFMTQHNVKASRKQLIPLLEIFLVRYHNEP